MRALVLDGIGFEHLRVESVPTPRPGSRQMLARVDCAGICTSLIKLVEQGSAHAFLYGWDPARWPLILGDEGSVTIVEVGSELQDRYSPGSRFVIQPAVDHAPVNHRERYLNGAAAVRKVAVGYTLQGHLAEYILVTEEVIEAGCLIPVPNLELPYAHAAMAEPFSCVVSGQDHHVHLSQETGLSPRSVLKGLRPGGVAVVLGAGAMGRMHVDLAFGYRPFAIVVTDLDDERLDLVRALFQQRAAQLGIALVACRAAEVINVVAALSEQRGADDVIVAVGSHNAIETAHQLVARGGVISLFGGLKHSEALVPVDTSAIHYKEINLTGSSGGSAWDLAHTLELMSAGQVDPGRHIARVGDLSHAVELLELVKSRAIDGKAVVYPHRPACEILRVTSWTASDERNYLQLLSSLGK
jgi:threonine dehydrogenase-like Zn-dependent dehydrogenase